MRILVIVILVLLPCLTSFSQDILPFAVFDYNGNEFSQMKNKFIKDHGNTLSTYVSNYLQKYGRNVLDTLCDAELLFVKFKLSKNEGILKVAVSRTSNLALAKTLKQAVESSSSYWTIKQDSPITYLMPVYYNYLTNCNDPKIERVSLSRVNIFSNYPFDFDDDTQIQNEECVILKPWHFNSGVRESSLVAPPKK